MDSLNNVIDSQTPTRIETTEVEDPNEQVIRLQRYIGQLVQAKTLCDNRLRYLERSNIDVAGSGTEAGGVNDAQYYDTSMSNPMMGQQVISLSFEAIMNSPFSRRYFYSYLEKQGKRRIENNYKQQPGFGKTIAPPYQVFIL